MDILNCFPRLGLNSTKRKIDSDNPEYDGSDRLHFFQLRAHSISDVIMASDISSNSRFLSKRYRFCLM